MERHSTTTTETNWTHLTTRDNIRGYKFTLTMLASSTIKELLWLEVPSLTQQLSEQLDWDSKASARKSSKWRREETTELPSLETEVRSAKHIRLRIKSVSVEKRTTELTPAHSCRNGSSALQATSSNEEPTLRPDWRRRYKLWTTTKTENKV
jgi:hypothetical protein